MPARCGGLILTEYELHLEYLKICLFIDFQAVSIHLSDLNCIFVDMFLLIV
jgi:hypothetical protein